jgi:hypothetical protein
MYVCTWKMGVPVEFEGFNETGAGRALFRACRR